MNEQQRKTIAAVLRQQGRRDLATAFRNVTAEGPDWKGAAAFASELGRTAAQLEKLLRDEREGEAHKHVYAAITDIAEILSSMAYAEVQPRASKQLLKVRDLLKPRFSR